MILPQKLLDDKVISVQSHPIHPDVKIYNYTAKCQIDRLWNRTTIQCRGLIMNEERVLGRPFKKFFNVEELQGLRNHLHHLYGVKYSELWNQSFTATAKEDGSLGILFRLPNGKWEWATRGSFTSEQSELARKIWRDNYNFDLDGRYTYLFEIVGPDNRIVLKYPKNDLIFLGAVDTVYGNDVSYTLSMNTPKVYSFASLTEAVTQAKLLVNEEGYVLRFENGFRCKVKGNWYCDIHRVVTQLSRKNVIEALQTGQIHQWLEAVPDEFYPDIRELMTEVQTEYKSIEDQAYADFKRCENPNRKKFAAAAKSTKYPHLLFKLYDRKYAELQTSIWKLL